VSATAKHHESASDTTSSGERDTPANRSGSTKRAPSAAKVERIAMPANVSTIGSHSGDSKLACNASTMMAQMSWKTRTPIESLPDTVSSKRRSCRKRATSKVEENALASAK